MGIKFSESLVLFVWLFDDGDVVSGVLGPGWSRTGQGSIRDNVTEDGKHWHYSRTSTGQQDI